MEENWENSYGGNIVKKKEKISVYVYMYMVNVLILYELYINKSWFFGVILLKFIGIV